MSGPRAPLYMNPPHATGIRLMNRVLLTALEDSAILPQTVATAITQPTLALQVNRLFNESNGIDHARSDGVSSNSFIRRNQPASFELDQAA